MKKIYSLPPNKMFAEMQIMYGPPPVPMYGMPPEPQEIIIKVLSFIILPISLIVALIIGLLILLRKKRNVTKNIKNR